ncbi:MAG: methyltransferase domain-containing protein [Terriglobales bacterium]
MLQIAERYDKRDFWIRENAQYAEANFRMRKCAKLINRDAEEKTLSLLDIGCGPAAMRKVVSSNVLYHGVDIAIHEPAPYLLERDFVQSEIEFQGKTFDRIVALGVFEYMGSHQARKLEEIRQLLNPGGKFILSYVNFGHYRRKIYAMYNNVQSIREMQKSLEALFDIERCFPVCHHWRHRQPGKNAIPGIQMRIMFGIPWISPWLATEYFFICSTK